MHTAPEVITAMIAAFPATQAEVARMGDPADRLRLASLGVAADLFRRCISGGEVAALLECLEAVQRAQTAAVWCPDDYRVNALDSAIEDLDAAFENLRDDLMHNLAGLANA